MPSRRLSRAANDAVRLLGLLLAGVIARGGVASDAAPLAVDGAPIAAPADFLRGCLFACGSHDACELTHLQSQFDELQQQISPQSLRRLPPRERLRTLHQRLHAFVLVGEYRQDASDLRQTLSRGDYNCLSATALYWALAQAAGLELEIWSLPGHVYLQATDPGRTLVEPARPAWPSAGQGPRPEQTAGRRLSPDQLAGKFYYNRGVLALKRGEHAAGIELLEQSSRLDPGDEEARANLLAGLNNWAVDRCRHEQFAAAQALIQQGLAIDGRFAPLLANERYVRAAQQAARVAP